MNRQQVTRHRALLRLKVLFYKSRAAFWGKQIDYNLLRIIVLKMNKLLNMIGSDSVTGDRINIKKAG